MRWKVGSSGEEHFAEPIVPASDEKVVDAQKGTKSVLVIIGTIYQKKLSVDLYNSC